MAKPKFDPSKPFEAAESVGAKPKFDPSLPFESGDGAAKPKGVQVYDEPAGPEQATAFGRFKERISDPERWKAIAFGKSSVGGLVKPSPYAPEIVQGDAPMILPGGAIPKLTKAATALAEGKTAAHILGRIGLSGTQGAVMSAAQGGPEGETFGEKIDRVKSSGKLSAGIQAAAEAIPVAGKALGWGARKVGAALSGEKEALIKNYSQGTDRVNNLIKQSGGDATQGADLVRREGMAGLQAKKADVNSAISKAISAAPTEATHDITPVIKKLEAARAKLNPNFKAGAIAEIDEMLAAIKTEAPDGRVNLSSLYQIKQFLNEGSSSAYNKDGQIFTRAGEAARAAKDAAGDARGVLKTASPEIAEADTYLSRLHRFEKDLNKNLLAEGKPDGALLAAGSGGNDRNAAKLKALERLSGVPFFQRAQDLATAKAFANPSLLPSDTTGKIVGRMAAGAGVGYLIDRDKGMYVGGALASPMALKGIINAKNVAGKLGSQFPNAAKFVRENPVAATAVTQLAAGQIRRANPPKREERQAPMLGKDKKGEPNRKPARDPQINDYAKKHGLTYDMAEAILRKRGYGK